jgi:hypothetical protein
LANDQPLGLVIGVPEQVITLDMHYALVDELASRVHCLQAELKRHRLALEWIATRHDANSLALAQHAQETLRSGVLVMREGPA